MHQALAGLLQSKLRAVILASHSSPLAHDAPSPPSTSGRCSGITMENSNGKDSLSLAVLTPTSTPPKGTDHSRGSGKMFHFFFFFLSHSPHACTRLLGVGKGGKAVGRTPQGLKYPPGQHNRQELGSLLAPLSHHFCARLPQWGLGFKEKAL